MSDRSLSKYTWCPGRDQWVDKLVCGRMIQEHRCTKTKGGCRPKRSCSISEEDRQRRRENILRVIEEGREMEG